MPTTASKENAGRLRTFKNKGKDQEEMRRRRNEVTVELRKAKRDGQMLKRRNVDTGPETPLTESNKQIPMDLSIPGIVQNVTSTDPQRQLAGVQSCRKLLSKERNPPLDSIIQSGIVPKLVELLARSDIHRLQFEAAWALTNIASGSSHQTRAVVEAGAVPMFVKLLSSEHMNVVDQAVWALGNIAGDGSECRDFTIRCGIIQPLLALIKPTLHVNYLRNVTWTLSNLCRNKNPPPCFETAQQLLPALAHLLQHADKDVVSDTCWALSYLTDGSTERIQAVVDAGVIPRLVELLKSNELACVPRSQAHAVFSCMKNVEGLVNMSDIEGRKTTELERGRTGAQNRKTPALRATGNIVTGSDHQTQIMLDTGVLKHFNMLLTHHRSNIQKEAAWTISNITAGQPHQIQSVVDAGLIPPIIDILIKGEYKAQKEAVWAVTNLSAGGSMEQIVYLVQAGVLKPLCDLLVVKETKIVTVILDAIMNILSAAAKIQHVDEVCILIEECGGLDKIEALQQHHHAEVYRLALSIIDKFFSEEEDEDQSVVPATAPATGTFQFAPATQTLPAGGFTF